MKWTPNVTDIEANALHIKSKVNLKPDWFKISKYVKVPLKRSTLRGI